MSRSELLVRIDDLLKLTRRLFREVRKRPTSKNVHQLRVTLRRLQACLILVPEMLDEKNKRRLKKLWKKLGAVRDLDVTKALAEEFSLPTKDILRERKKKRAKLTNYLEKMKKLSLQDPPSLVNPLPRIRELRLKLIRTPPKEENIHKIRILIKKIRYLREALGLPVEKFKPYQDTLGAHQDLEVFLSNYEENKEMRRRINESRKKSLSVIRKAGLLGLKNLDEMERHSE